MTADLPRVPYTTILDGYLNAGILLLGLLITESAVIVHFPSERQPVFDVAFAKIVSGLWINWNFWFVASKAWYLRKLARNMPQRRGKEAEHKPSARCQRLESLQPGAMDRNFQHQQKLLGVLLLLVLLVLLVHMSRRRAAALPEPEPEPEPEPSSQLLAWCG